MPFFDIPGIRKTGLKIFWAYFFQDFSIVHLTLFNSVLAGSDRKYLIFKLQKIVIDYNLNCVITLFSGWPHMFNLIQFIDYSINYNQFNLLAVTWLRKSQLDFLLCVDQLHFILNFRFLVLAVNLFVTGKGFCFWFLVYSFPLLYLYYNIFVATFLVYFMNIVAIFYIFHCDFIQIILN